MLMSFTKIIHTAGEKKRFEYPWLMSVYNTLRIQQVISLVWYEYNVAFPFPCMNENMSIIHNNE